MSWDELVAAALVGTERRPVEPDAPPGAPAALGAALRDRGEDGVLAAAAAWTVARRAGAAPGPRHEVEPAPADPRPLCSPAAAARLEALLDSDGILVEQWLDLAAERGVRPPPELVPWLLDDAVGDPGRQQVVVAAAGPLGAWLAARNARWAFVPGAEEPQEAWERGEPAARRLLLQRLRLADPAAGRALLERTLASETAEDRAAFVRRLSAGLSDADEPLLERVLDDRRQEVRAAAAEQLARLPRSRFGARMAERAVALLRLQEDRLVVELPGEPDAAARRDGVPRRGRRSEALAYILSRAPLATWSQQVLALPVADDFQDLVHGALAEAALAQHDEAWARALWPREPELLNVLPKEERERLAATLPLDRIAVLPPWGAELSRAVVAKVAAAVATDRPPAGLAYALDPSVLAELEPLIEAGGRPIARLRDVLATRAAMLRELS